MYLPNPTKTASVLLEHSKQSYPPVDLDKIIALYPKIQVTEENLDGEGYFVDLGSIGAEIIVRSQAILPRKRYTIAHELGHWILKSPDFCNFNGTKIIPRHMIEKWCDTFAACLLMPETWIIQDLRRAKLKGLLDAILSLPNIYQVSNQAFRIRVSELTPVSMFLLCQLNGEVSMDQHFETKKISERDIHQTLEKVKSLFTQQDNISWSKDPRTNLVFIGKVLSQTSKGKKWFVCILPSKNQSRICP